MSQSRLSIPKPCHEDWDAMRPEDRGRHCALCNKVVRDFSTQSPEQILASVQTLPPGAICGRIPAHYLAPAPLPAQVWMRYPVTRLRHFLIALIATFGWSIFGIPELAAQSLPIPQPTHLKRNTATLSLRGIVREQYSNDPLEGVEITAIRKGTIGGRAISDSTGHFEIPLSPQFLRQGPYDLKLYYFGLSYTEPQVPADVAELAITVDMSIDMPAIPLTSTIPSWNKDDLTTTGVIIVAGGIHSITLDHLDYRPDKYLYRPLDEWLMMHNSEINHTGRH